MRHFAGTCYACGHTQTRAMINECPRRTDKTCASRHGIHQPRQDGKTASNHFYEHASKGMGSATHHLEQFVPRTYKFRSDVASKIENNPSWMYWKHPLHAENGKQQGPQSRGGGATMTQVDIILPSVRCHELVEDTTSELLQILHDCSLDNPQADDANNDTTTTEDEQQLCMSIPSASAGVRHVNHEFCPRTLKGKRRPGPYQIAPSPQGPNHAANALLAVSIRDNRVSTVSHHQPLSPGIIVAPRAPTASSALTCSALSEKLLFNPASLMLLDHISRALTQHDVKRLGFSEFPNKVHNIRVRMTQATDEIRLTQTWLQNACADLNYEAFHMVLIYAVLRGDVDFVNSLVRAGVDPNRRDEVSGLRPIHYAILGRSPGMTQVLIENGAHVHIDDDASLNTPEYRWVNRILLALTCYMGSDDVSGITCSEVTQSEETQREQPSAATKNEAAVVHTQSQAQEPSQLNAISAHGQSNQPVGSKANSVLQPGATTTDSSGDYAFACPYVVYDPTRYSDKRCCGLTSYETIPRLKEHLYKQHRICEQCRKSFAKEDLLQEHNMADCAAVDEVSRRLSDGFVASQADKMKKRWTKQKPVEKWKKIYRILFEKTESDTIPSPYFETKNQLQYENDWLRNEIKELRDENERLRRLMQSQQVVPQSTRLSPQTPSPYTQTTLPGTMQGDATPSGFGSSELHSTANVYQGRNTAGYLADTSPSGSRCVADDTSIDLPSSSGSGLGFACSSTEWLGSSYTGYSEDVDFPSQTLSNGNWGCSESFQQYGGGSVGFYPDDPMDVISTSAAEQMYDGNAEMFVEDRAKARDFADHLNPDMRGPLAGHLSEYIEPRLIEETGR